MQYLIGAAWNWRHKATVLSFYDDETCRVTAIDDPWQTIPSTTLRCRISTIIALARSHDPPDGPQTLPLPYAAEADMYDPLRGEVVTVTRVHDPGLAFAIRRKFFAPKKSNALETALGIGRRRRKNAQTQEEFDDEPVLGPVTRAEVLERLAPTDLASSIDQAVAWDAGLHFGMPYRIERRTIQRSSPLLCPKCLQFCVRKGLALYYAVTGPDARLVLVLCPACGSVVYSDPEIPVRDAGSVRGALEAYAALHKSAIRRVLGAPPIASEDAEASVPVAVDCDIPGFGADLARVAARREAELTWREAHLGIPPVDRAPYAAAEAEYLRKALTPVPPLPCWGLDIETKILVGDAGPDPVHPKAPVLAVTFVSPAGERHAFYCSKLIMEPADGSLVIDRPAPPTPAAVAARGLELLGGGPALQAQDFAEEAQMLKAVFQFLRAHRGQIYLTYNGDAFDLCYLYNRAMMFATQNNIYIGEGDIQITRLAGRDYNIDGSIHLDLFRYFNWMHIRGYLFDDLYDAYPSLDEVAQAFAGQRKLSNDLAGGMQTYSVEELVAYSVEELVAYCVRDSELLPAIVRARDGLVAKTILVLCRLACTSVENVARRGMTTLFGDALAATNHRNNYLPYHPGLPGDAGAEEDAEESEKQGALCSNALVGVLLDVVALDVASLYPSAIGLMNVSYETTNRCPLGGCALHHAIRYIPPQADPHRDYDLPPQRTCCQALPGILPLILGPIRHVRVAVFKPRTKRPDQTPDERALNAALSGGLKVFINGAHGTLGAEPFAAYCPDAYNAVTDYGRLTAYNLYRRAESLPTLVARGDTDATMPVGPTDAEIKALQAYAAEEMGLELEVDATYAILFSTTNKKNYIGFKRPRPGKPVADPLDLTKISKSAGFKSDAPAFVPRALMHVIRTIAGWLCEPEPAPVEQLAVRAVDLVIETYCATARDAVLSITTGQGPLAVDDYAIHMRLGKALEDYADLPQRRVGQRIRALVEGAQVSPAIKADLEAWGCETAAPDRGSTIRKYNGPNDTVLCKYDIMRKGGLTALDATKYLEPLDTGFAIFTDSFTEIIARAPDGGYTHTDLGDWRERPVAALGGQTAAQLLAELRAAITAASSNRL